MTDFVTSYLAWLKSQFSCRETSRYTEITTPFLDRHNDQIQIYAVPTADGWSLTDAGETLSDLEMCGVHFESAKRKALLHEVLQGFGLTLRDGELTVSADAQSQPQQMNNLIQAVLAVNDLFCLAQPTVYPFFTENVSQWLDEKAIRFSPQVSFSGKSTFSHHYDRLSHSEIQTVAGTPFESHEYPEPRLRQTSRLQLDRYEGNTSGSVGMLRASERCRRHPRRRADVAGTV